MPMLNSVKELCGLAKCYKSQVKYQYPPVLMRYITITYFDIWESKNYEVKIHDYFLFPKG